jgi:LacI family transcriptional regulator
MAVSVTQSEVARRAGVSQRTVSYALTQPDRVAEPTRRKVLETAQRLGFRTNSSAKAMRSGRFGAIALVMSTVKYRSRLFDDLLASIDEALSEEDMHLTVTRMPDDQLVQTGAMPRLMREQLVDGLLFNYTSLVPAPLRQMIDRSRLPAVWINSDADHDCVRPDDLAGGRLATTHLLELGHRRIAYLRFGPEEHFSTIDRRRGYEAAMHAAGLTPLLGPKAEIDDDRTAICRDWLDAQTHRPTAVVSYGDVGAIPLMIAAGQLGLRVPEDLSILTFEGGSHVELRLSHVRIPNDAMGREAVDLLNQKIATPDRRFDPVVLPMTLQSGATCAPPTCSA